MPSDADAVLFGAIPLEHHQEEEPEPGPILFFVQLEDSARVPVRHLEDWLRLRRHLYFGAENHWAILDAIIRSGRVETNRALYEAADVTELERLVTRRRRILGI